MLKILIMINLTLLTNIALAGFFAQFNLHRWLVKDGLWSRRRSMMMPMMMRSGKGSKMESQTEMEDDPWNPMDDVPMENLIQDSWGSESKSSQPTCNCNCGGGKGDKKMKGKKSKGGGGTMAIVIPKYEYFDVPMAKEIETESLGKVIEKSVSYKSGWGQSGGGDSGW
ncbi:uncharacterized protein LOC107359194 [Tetranychus urticae]|uniref:uncharacterized protein LOC107359194 n=1 Tax=Tetranychus urticae TaxID=32264 RepID=UPI00077BB05A|nr:uncharacterized protein LOC107359194 [Tetranychus urticae]